jgi:hypothetical protein
VTLPFGDVKEIESRSDFAGSAAFIPGVSELTRRGCVTLAGMRFPALTPYWSPNISSMQPLLRAGRKFAMGTLVCQGLRCGHSGHGEGEVREIARRRNMPKITTALPSSSWEPSPESTP